jgi:hypothetical protein
MLFNSRGFKDAAAAKGAELEASLVAASEGGKLPIVLDTSPCLALVKASIRAPALPRSKAAPPRVASTLMGVAFLSPFAAHVTAGWVGSYFDTMSPSAFWTMDAAIGVVGALVILLLRKPLIRELDGAPEARL